MRRAPQSALDRELRAWLGKAAAPLLDAIKFKDRSATEWVKDPVTPKPDPIVAALLDAHDLIQLKRTMGLSDEAFDADFRVVLERINASPAARRAMRRASGPARRPGPRRARPRAAGKRASAWIGPPSFDARRAPRVNG